MIIIQAAIILAVLATLWWAAKPNTTNHAANDEDASRGSFAHEGERND